MPEKRQEFIKIEGGICQTGEVIFEDSNLFTEFPKISLTPITNQIALTILINRTLTGFEYRVKVRVWWRWRDRTTEIPVIWIAIQEK